MSSFVEECRREWRRLGVPDILADEMAEDLEADLAEARSEGVPASELVGDGDPRRFAATWASERGLVTEESVKRRHTVAWPLLAAGTVIILTAGIALPLVLSGTGASPEPSTSTPSGPLTFEHTSAFSAMKSVFSHPPANPVPASISHLAASLATGAPPGTPGMPRGILVHQGRLLLSNLGPARRAIYVFPTRNKEVCFVISGRGGTRARNGLGAGCQTAFVVGEPASVGGGVLHSPPTSGPPAEIAGLTKDGVTGVSVVVNGIPHKAAFGHNAWYYRFPNNHTPATAATALLVTLSSGTTRPVLLDLAPPNMGRPR